ncbi:DUF5507 domain-containing protein [Escherichia coli]
MLVSKSNGFNASAVLGSGSYNDLNCQTKCNDFLK